MKMNARNEETDRDTDRENEVIELGARIKRDRDRLNEILAGGRASQEPPRESRPGSRVTRGAGRGGRGRRKSSKEVMARIRGRSAASSGSAEPEDRVTFHPEMMVECSLCGVRVGTRRHGSVPYPYRHEGPDGRPCKGAKQPAKLVTQES